MLRIPKLTKSSAVGFIGENELIPSDHDTTFDEVVLMPTDRKSIKVIERYSRELARQAVIGIDATLKNRLVKVVSDKLDTALLTGHGAATDEVQTVTITGTDRRHLHPDIPRGHHIGAGIQRRLRNCADRVQALSTVDSANATVTGSPAAPTP